MFFPWNLHAFHVYKKTEENISIEDRITHPFMPHRLITVYSEDIIKKAHADFNQKNEIVKEHELFLEILNEFTVDQMTLLFNKKNIRVSLEQLDILYNKPQSSRVISFILENKLSFQDTLILLLPFLRENLLTDLEIIEILQTTKFDFNTLIQFKDFVDLFSVKNFQTYHFQESSTDLENDSKEFSNNFLNLDTRIVITSLAHIAILYRRLELIKFLYKNEDFNPQVVNHALQTPLHNLFDSFFSQSSLKIWSEKDWIEVLNVIFKNKKVDLNSRDIHGFVPMAIAILEGHKKALSYFLRNEKVNLFVKDNYGRSLILLASQSKLIRKKEIVNLLYEKGIEITPSKFNDYLDKNFNSIQIQTISPLEEIIVTIAGIIDEKRKEKQISNQRAYLSLKALWIYDQKIKKSQRVKSFLKDLLKQSDNYYEKPVIDAIKADDSIFFETFFKEKYIIEFINQVFLDPFRLQSSQKNKIKNTLSYHLLLLAIEENSPKVVKFFMENITNPLILNPSSNKKKSYFYYMDPLSEAFLNLASLNFLLPSRLKKDRKKIENSKEIINIIRTYIKDFEIENFMNLNPMKIAYLTGNMKEVQRLNSKGILTPKGDIWRGVSVSFKEFFTKQNPTSSCKSVF
ncbi:MAG: ankyrin repeat domain-containing protein [Bdellovibrionales bacterium]|nr:ankyrin repeat domain-containing protein [Bdellovibrionales bacterium]